MLDLNDAGYIRLADMISQVLRSYVTITPKGIFRTYTVGEPECLLVVRRRADRFKNTFILQFSVFQYVESEQLFKRNFSSYDPRILRGGSALMSNPYWTFFVNAGTANAKDLHTYLSA